MLEQSTLCPRCTGTGLKPNFSHVRNGVCFRCWGCGLDLQGDLVKARKKLAGLRRRWASLRDRRNQEPVEACKEIYAQEMAKVVTQGKATVALISNLEGTLSSYEKQSKPQ